MSVICDISAWFRNKSLLKIFDFNTKSWATKKLANYLLIISFCTNFVAVRSSNVGQNLIAIPSTFFTEFLNGCVKSASLFKLVDLMWHETLISLHFDDYIENQPVVYSYSACTISDPCCSSNLILLTKSKSQHDTSNVMYAKYFHCVYKYKCLVIEVLAHESNFLKSWRKPFNDGNDGFASCFEKSIFGPKWN